MGGPHSSVKYSHGSWNWFGGLSIGSLECGLSSSAIVAWMESQLASMENRGLN